MSNQITFTGRAGADSETRMTPSGTTLASVNLADTPRKKDESGQWVDAGPTLWLRVTVFGEDAQTLQVRKGDKVTVVGKLRADEWQDKQTGETRKGVSVIADAVAVHAPKQQQGQATRQQQAPASDPWGSAPQQQGFGQAATDEPPF